LLLVAFLLVNAPNFHLSLVLVSVVQGDAVNCNTSLHRYISLSLFLSLWGRVLWSPIVKLTFACYSRSPISLIFSAWDQYKLAQVLNSNLISEWLSERKLKRKESHLKTLIELYLIETLTKLLYLFRSNYV